MYQIPALNTMDTPEERLDFLNQQLRIIATSAQQAKARGDQATLTVLLDLYNKARADARMLRGEANDADQPAAFLVALDRFSDFAGDVGQQVLDIPKQALNLTALVLVAAVVVVGIGLNKGSLSFRR